MIIIKTTVPPFMTFILKPSVSLDLYLSEMSFTFAEKEVSGAHISERNISLSKIITR